MVYYCKIFVCMFLMTAALLHGFENQDGSNGHVVLMHQDIKSLTTVEPYYDEEGIRYEVIEMTETEKRLAWIELAKILQDFL